MNGNERTFANKVPVALEVANAVNNFMAFVEEPMAGAWTNANALAKAEENEDDTAREMPRAKDTRAPRDSLDGLVSRCW